MKIKGKFTSIWDNGTFVTPAILDTETGEIITDSINVNNDLGLLNEEWFEDENGEEYSICPDCHNHILKTTIKDGIGHNLYEAQVCTDPECTNQ